MVMVLECLVSCFRGEETHGFYVLSILGATRLVYARFIALQSRDREMEPLVYTISHGSEVVPSTERERSIGIPKETPDSPIVFARAQNTADAQVAKGESEVGVHLDICLELGVNYIKLLLLAPPKHGYSTESGTLFNHRYSGICAR